MKKFFFSLIAFLFVLICLLLTLEFAFCFFRGRPFYLAKTIGKTETKREHHLEPNQTFQLKDEARREFDVTVTVNRHGYRGSDFEKENPKDKVRIFVLGDSFTYGVGAEDDETIPALLEKNLLEKGLPVEVINAGIGGAATVEHYFRMRDIHMPYRPDYVIFLMDFSDMQDDWRLERRLIRDKEDKLQMGDPSMVFGKRNWWLYLTQRSEFCKYLHNKLVRTCRKIQVLGLGGYLKAKLQSKRAKSVIVNMASGDEAKHDPIEYDQYLLIRGREKLPDIERHFKRTGNFILMLRDLLKEEQIPMMMGIYPYGIHVGTDQWGEGRQHWGFEANKVYSDTFAFDLVANFAESNELHCLNTLPFFLQHTDEMLYFPFDGHLKPRGNEVVAKALSLDAHLLQAIRQIQVKKGILEPQPALTTPAFPLQEADAPAE